MLTFLLMVLWSFNGITQSPFTGFDHLFTPPKSYNVFFAANAPAIDGDISEEVWKQARWSEEFTDIEGDKKQKPLYKTKIKLLWSDSCLFIAAELEEPHVWSTLKNHDDIIYHDNDFEVFIDPGNSTHLYYEIEVNAANTIMDLLMPKPYRNGAAAMLSFDMCELQSAVKVQGTLNNPNDKDVGWTVEMAIPFKAMYRGNQWKAPIDGSLWRLNFSRVQWHTEIQEGKYIKKRDSNGKVMPEQNWVWSPQGVINMHYPERWGYLQFHRDKTAENEMFQLPYGERRRQYLWWLYYQQKEYLRIHNRYATSLKDLGITSPQVSVNNLTNKLNVEATSRQFTVSISDASSTLLINEDGLVQVLNKVL